MSESGRKDMDMDMEHTIISNQPIDASISWVKSGEKMSVVFNANGKDIVIGMAELFSAILEAEREQGIPRKVLSTAVLRAIREVTLEKAKEG